MRLFDGTLRKLFDSCLIGLILGLCFGVGGQGVISVERRGLTSVGISMIKNKMVTWSSIFIIGISIPGKTVFILTHWGRVMHICISKITIIGSDNGLAPSIWTNAGIFLIGPLGRNVSEILIANYAFSLKKVRWKMLSGKWGPFCFGLNVLIEALGVRFKLLASGGIGTRLSYCVQNLLYITFLIYICGSSGNWQGLGSRKGTLYAVSHSIAHIHVSDTELFSPFSVHHSGYLSRIGLLWSLCGLTTDELPW